MQAVFRLIKKDIILEWRNSYSIVSILLYIACTVFALYMMMGKPEARVWNGLFWLAQLFIVVNSVAKSFLQEGFERARYYYTIVKPWQYMISKILYNLLFVTLVGFISLLIFTVLLGNVFHRIYEYYLLALFGVGSLSVLFTFLSAIAAQAKQGAALIAVLGFPIAIPLIMILAKASLGAIAPVVQEGWWSMILIVGGMELLMIMLAVILFPHLWKE